MLQCCGFFKYEHSFSTKSWERRSPTRMRVTWRLELNLSEWHTFAQIYFTIIMIHHLIGWLYQDSISRWSQRSICFCKKFIKEFSQLETPSWGAVHTFCFRLVVLKPTVHGGQSAAVLALGEGQAAAPGEKTTTVWFEGEATSVEPSRPSSTVIDRRVFYPNWTFFNSPWPQTANL